MSDKRKGFRHLFTLGFFATVLIAIGGFMAWCIYYFIVLFVGMSSVSADPEPPGDSLQITYDSVPQQPIDSVERTAKKIMIDGDEYHPNEIHDSLFSFKINYDSTKNGIGEWNKHIKSVIIFRLADQKKIQKVVPPEIFAFESYNVPVIVEDMNFDGYSDLRVLNFVPMYQCETYYYWLYNPEKEYFDRNKALEVTSNVKFDEQAKTITSHFRGGGPFDQINEFFVWDKNSLALQSSEEVFMGIKNMEGTFTMKKRVDGKLVERSRRYDSIPFTPDGQLDFRWDSLK